MKISTLDRLDCVPPRKVSELLESRKDEFQMMPEAAAQALELVKNPSCKIALVAKTIERDVNLATGIISMSNSPMFSAGLPITNVRDAVIHVGFRQCQNLIHASCAKSLMQKANVGFKAERKLLLSHSLATAGVATQLNRMFELGLRGEEFTAGLLHDVGRLLLAAFYPDEFVELNQLQSLESAEALVREQELVGVNHAAMGCLFAISNRIPEELAEAIRFHHEPHLARQNPKLTAVVSLADSLANSEKEFDETQCPGLDAVRQIYGDGVAANIVESLPTVLTEALSSFVSV